MAAEANRKLSPIYFSGSHVEFYFVPKRQKGPLVLKSYISSKISAMRTVIRHLYIKVEKISDFLRVRPTLDIGVCTLAFGEHRASPKASNKTFYCLFFWQEYSVYKGPHNR